MFHVFFRNKQQLFPQNSFNQVTFLMETRCVFFAVGTELNII
jgi:hypothetical protein